MKVTSVTESLGPIKKHPVVAVVVVLVLIWLFASAGNTSPQSTNQASVTPPTPAEIVCGMSSQDIKTKAMTIDYKQLDKDPNSFQGTFAKFSGQILQIQQSGDFGVIRLSVTNLGGGYWSPNDVVYIEYNRATSAVQGDIVTAYGMMNGTQTYTSQANYQITLPYLVACGIGSNPGTATSTNK